MNAALCSVLIAAVLASTAHAHGQMMEPAFRPVTDKYRADCGALKYAGNDELQWAPLENLSQRTQADQPQAATFDIMNGCRGMVYEASNPVTALQAGVEFPVKWFIQAPHPGYAEFNIVKPKTGAGGKITYEKVATLKRIEDFAKSGGNDEDVLTIPASVTGCETAGACALQMYWHSDIANQTYPTCADITVGGSGAGTPAATDAPSDGASDAGSDADAETPATDAPATSADDSAAGDADDGEYATPAPAATTAAPADDEYATPSPTKKCTAKRVARARSDQTRHGGGNHSADPAAQAPPQRPPQHCSHARAHRPPGIERRRLSRCAFDTGERSTEGTRTRHFPELHPSTLGRHNPATMRIQHRRRSPRTTAHSTTSCVACWWIVLVLLQWMSVHGTNVFSPQDVPGPPEKVWISAASESSLRVQFSPPARMKAEGNNGAPVLGYKVQVAKRVNAVQTFTVDANGPVLAGSYKLAFKSADGVVDTTTCIPWNATEVEFEMALEELPKVDAVSVSRIAHGGGGARANGFVYSVEFDGKYLVSGKQPNLLLGVQNGCQATLPRNRVLTFTGAHVTAGVPGYSPEVWEVRTNDTAGTNALGGSFDLSLGFEGAWQDSTVTATVSAGSQTAITSASMVGKVNRGDKIMLGEELFYVHASASFTDTELPLDSYHIRGATNAAIYVQDTVLGDVAVTEGSQVVTTAKDFRQDVAIHEHIKIGDWEFDVTAITDKTLRIAKIAATGKDNWPEASTPHITAYKRKKVTVSATAEAADVRKALDGLPGIGKVDVSRLGPTNVNGYRWYITFLSLGSATNCPESPCLHADKVTGSKILLTDAYGRTSCATCVVDASVQEDDTGTQPVVGITGEYASTSIVATEEVDGVVDEVQSIATQAADDDIRGTFEVNFRNSFAQSPGAVINFDDTAADVQAKLQNLPTVGRLHVTKADNAQFGVTWTITFLSNIGDLPLFSIDDTLLTGTDGSVVVQEIVKGVDVPFEAIVDGLSPDEEDYYVRAFARNLNGYGPATDILQRDGKGALPLYANVGSAPDAPSVLGMWPLSDSEMEVWFKEPVNHGDPVRKYVLEYAVGDSFGTPAVKILRICNSLANDIAGSFRLQYGDDVSPLLSVHASSQVLRDALRSLPSLRPVVVNRATYVLTGELSSHVKSFAATSNLFTTTELTLLQVQLLVVGSFVSVENNIFVVKSQPTPGSTTLEVRPGHGVASFTQKTFALLKLDESGSERGPHGYEWTLSFVGEIEKIAHQVYPGLQLVSSSLTSVETGAQLANIGITDKQLAVPPTYHGSFDISNNDDICDTYVIGAPSPVQVLQLFASTTITGGRFKLQLGQETTSCITLGATTAKSTMKTALEALEFVSSVTVEEQRMFKVSVLTGSATSKVTAYDSVQNTLAVTSTGPGLTATEAQALRLNTIIRVSRNSNDFTRHSCEFTVATAATAGATTLAVSAVGDCVSFSAESRSLQILDVHDFKIRFWGQYPTGEWPTLKIVQAAFGAGVCAPWVPAATPMYGTIHTIQYEGICARGSGGTQTIVADAATEIGGWFSLSYLGNETPPLTFKATTASVMRDAIESITARGSVENVRVSQYGSYGRAWHISFTQSHDESDTIFIKHAYLTGQSAFISVYPTVEVFTDAKQDDISGSFRLAFEGESTEAIGFAATHLKVTQELQKLSHVDSVIALGDADAGDVGVSSLVLTAQATFGDALLTDIKLNGKSIDPTLFVGVREKLVIGAAKYWIQALSQADITLTSTFRGSSGVVTVAAGLITRRTKPLPGYVGISRFMRVITAAKGGQTIELPSDHGYVRDDVFFVNGQKLTVAAVATGVITTREFFMGSDIVAASPEVYVFDNSLRTTEDLSQLVAVGDDLWLPSSSAEMINYKVTQVTSRFLQVDGVFTDAVVKSQAFHVASGRKWSLVFRSYTGDLDTIDAVPANDWRGTDVRLGTRRATAVRPQTIRVGNPAVTQTVLLEANSAADVGTAATYKLTFGDETTDILKWTDTESVVKGKLEALDGIDGVTVTSVVYANGYVHSISFWGTYPTSTLPVLGSVLVSAVVPANVAIRIHSNHAVARSKQQTLILDKDQNYVFRIFAMNGKGVSDSKMGVSTRSAMSSIVPTPPTSVSLGEYHGPTWLSVHYRAPIYMGGAEVTMYRLEWDSSPTFDSSSADYGVANIQKRFEVQQVTTIFRSDMGIGGTFTLSWGGRTTTPLAIDCTAAQMTDALAIITDTVNVAVDPVKVVRTRVSWGYAWAITFRHNPGDLALLLADSSLMTGDFPRITVTEVVRGFSDLAIGDFTHEVQEIFTDAITLLAGSFTLEFEGKVSRSISVDATALEMQEALQDTTTVYSIKVSKTWKSQVLNTAIWSVTFAYLRGEELVGAGNIFTITVADASLLEGTSASVRIANKVVGSDPFAYTIAGLRTGVRYYFHAMAYNAEGFGSATSPMSSAVTCGHPDPPSSVVATVVNGTTLAVTWGNNQSDGECAVDKYKIEWYRAEGAREEQTVTTSAGQGLPEIQRILNFADSASLGGYFKLDFNGETTENVRWNAPAVGLNSVKERLERLSTVGTVEVTRKQSTRVVAGLMVTGSGSTLTRDASSSSSTVTIASSGFAVGDAIWIAGQQFAITAVGASTLTIAGTLATAVPVPVFRSAYGFQWLVTFLSGHVGPQALLQVTPSDSWTGNSPGIYVDSVQQGLQPISGTFRLSFASGGISQTTPPLPHNISAIEMQNALESLVTIGLVQVTRSSNGYGYNWIVTFLTDLKDDIALLGVDGTELHGPSVRILAARTSVGIQPTLYCETNGVVGTPAEVMHHPTALRYEIGGLQTGQGYVVRVRAHNAEGYGGASYIAPAFQVPRTTPSAPKDVQLLVLSSQFLKLRWDAPASDGGMAISSYKIQWDISSGFTNVGSPNYDFQDEILVQSATDQSPFFFNIPITFAATYFARVLAVNDQGEGPPQSSDPASATPLNRTPGQPEHVNATVLSSYAILVEWDPSSTEKAYYGGDGGLPITQYMVEWDDSAAFDSPASFGLVRGTIHSYIIGGNDPITGVRSSVLIPGTMYSIRVTAFNANGAGQPRVTVPPRVLVVNQVPTAPRDLLLSVIPATSIKAEWTNPLYDGGASLKSYQVEWDEQDDFSSGQSSKATIPIVRELQSVIVSNEVVNEEQLVDATVEVVNEQQVVRTIFTGADEIQVIETTNAQVVDEIQTVTTSASDRNEVQELRLDADDVNEVQAIRTSVPDIFEIQQIQVSVQRVPEVQTVALTIVGAASNLANIGGDLFLTFNNTLCTHCTLPRGEETTANLLSSLQESNDTVGAEIVQDALIALGNIDTVLVERTTTTVGADLTYGYTITFSGDAVVGNVPELKVGGIITVNAISNSGSFPAYATESSIGNEVLFGSASVFTITSTCESYSDPNADKSYNESCTPPPTDRRCAACVTSFDGLIFSVAQDLRGSITAGDRLLTGPCVLEVDTITDTTITVAATDVGALCGTFTGKALDLFKAQKNSTAIPVKTSATTISDGSVVEKWLNKIIDSVKVVSTQVITATLVGAVYDVTFRKRSGMIPLLECDATWIQVAKTGATKSCTVVRKTIGSIIAGSFVLGLARESDGQVVPTAAIPWDASEALMTSTLEAVGGSGEKVFGSVKVKRTVFSSTGDKWSGGFTWQIEFTSRGWNIPAMQIVTNSLANSDPAKTKPTISIEDADNLLTPSANSTNGNQIAGDMTLYFRGITSAPCVIGQHTSLATLQESVLDTTFSAFLVAQFGSVIPSISVNRSAATQARGFTWSITFSDAATGGDVPILEIPLTALTGKNVRTTMHETIKGNQLGGTFQLTFNGETTGPIGFAADKLVVQAQLNSLSSIKPSSVVVDRSGPAIDSTTQVLGYTWLITFRSSVWADPRIDHSSGISGNWKGVRAKWDDVWPETGYSKAWGRHVGPMNATGFMLACSKTGLTTTASDQSQDCQTAVQTPGVGPLKGTFTLTLDSRTAGFMSVKQSVTSAPIAHNAWATKADSGATGTSVEEILEKMANIGDVAVTRSQVDALTGGYTWTVTFLRDANGTCEQEEESTSGVRLCNSPGDVPAMVASATGLRGSTPMATVCEKTLGNCLTSTVQNGLILRGDFTSFKVTNDPGFDERYKLTVGACTDAGGAVIPCDPVESFNVESTARSGRIVHHLLVGDRFTVGLHSTCIFQVASVTATKVKVASLSCPTMGTGAVSTTAMNVYIRVPWNAAADLVQRVLEASSDTNNEPMGSIWEDGRKVSVQRTIHGKHGEVSWHIRFISNPAFTPPGAGNLPAITTTFVPTPTVPFSVTVTQVTPGSTGLSGSFLIDFHSTIGPRPIRFDESEDRLQRKLNEMNTIGRVIVKKIKYPSNATGCSDSSCSGGWDHQPVDFPGTRGGYRWRIRFLKVTGEYGGLTFPSGSGNVEPLSVSVSSLQGTEKAIDVTTSVAGSSPILGGFVLNTSTKATPVLPYSSSSDSIKQGIESMFLFGEVEVTKEYFVTQQIPNAVATIAKDALTATITGVDDIRLFVAPGDIVRFGPASADTLVGTNGDSPLSSVLATSQVTVAALSPIVHAADPAMTKLLFPGVQLRIDGLVYAVQRSGHEIQTIAVTLPLGAWNASEARPYFRLTLTRGGSSQETDCLRFNEDPVAVETALNAKLKLLVAASAQLSDIKVTRSGPVETENGARKGYVYSIYFQGDTVAGDVSPLVDTYASCTAIADATVVIKTVTHGGDVGHQRVSLATDSGQVVDTNGYFTLTLNGRTTSCLPWGVTAETLEAEVEGKLLTGDVLVSRHGSGESATEVQRLRLTSNSEVTSTNTGLFQLMFTLDGKTAATGCLAYGIAAEDLELKLNQMSNLVALVTHVHVTREGDGTSAWGYGYEYLIHFDGPIAGGYSPVLGNVNQLQIINVGNSPCAAVVGGNPALLIETVREGAAGFDYDIFFVNYPTAVTPLLLLQDERVAGACPTGGWTHTGGSARKASIAMVAYGGSNEIQTLIVKDPSAPIPASSKYKLSFGGATYKTVCLSYDASASDVQTELGKVSTIGVGSVEVSRDVDPMRAPNGFVYKITFTGPLVTGNVPSLQVILNDGGCPTTMPLTSTVAVTTETEGGQPSGDFALTRSYDGEQPGTHVAYSVSQLFSVMHEQFEIQQLTVSNPLGNLVATDTYKLTLGAFPETAAIKWNANEVEVEAALTVTGINAGDIIVTRRSDSGAGYVYTIYFSGDAVKGNLPAMTVAKAFVAGSAGDVAISTLSHGVDRVASLKATSIPLALPSSPTAASSYVGSDAVLLNVYKVNGFFWTIKFKSTIGNLPALGANTDTLTGKLTIVDDFVPGATSNAFVMDNLLPGINYYVRVAAATDLGRGPFTLTESTVPSGVALPVQGVTAGYALYAREVQEVRLAATHIPEIQEITTSAAVMAEVQTLRTYASSDLCFDGNCVHGSLAFRVPTIQTLTVTALAPITSGSFSLQFTRYESNGLGAFKTVGNVVDTEAVQKTIAWNAPASDVQAAMEALSGIDPGDIVVTRDGDGSAAFGYGYIYSITFVGNNVAGQTSTMTVKSKTTGCSSCATFVVAGGLAHRLAVDVHPALAMGTDTAVQQVIVNASQPLYAGSYKLRFNHLGATVDSACITHDAPARGSDDARAMENILQQMTNVDRVYVTRQLDPVIAPNGFIYTLFFYGNGVYGDINVLGSSMCTPFQTQTNNALTSTNVNGLVTTSMVDPGGFNARNTFVHAANASADQLQRDLGRLPVFGDVIASRSLADEQGGFVWTVAFKDSEGDLPQFICAKDSVFAAKTGTGCETSTLTDGNVLSGNFVVEASTAIAFNANAVAVKAALEAMAWVGTVQVVQSAPSAQMGYTWTITFLDYFGDVPPLMVTSSLVGTGASIRVREVRKGNRIAGTFTLAYMGNATSPIAWDAKAMAVDSGSDGTSLQENLEALDSVGTVNVERSSMDREGGLTWHITFLDNTRNAGDLPLLQSDSTDLTGVGVVAVTREVRKGSHAVGDQLWLSFDPPESDNGSPITKYQVRWDTSATLSASPEEHFITEPEILYQTQQIVTGAQSLAWSSIKAQPVSEVQSVTIANTATNGATFSLSFRGATTGMLTVGVSSAETLASALTGLSTVGSVVVTPAATTVLTPGTVCQVTFTVELGDLPLMASSADATASIAEIQQGVTNFRKEVVVFSCVGTSGTVKFASGLASRDVAFDATLADLDTVLHTLFSVEADSITVSSTQALSVCAGAPRPITIVFDRVYGNTNLQITSTNTAIALYPAASIDGVYNDVPAKMSGTFQVGYHGKFTRPLNAESSADDVRYALEDLSSIQTVGVSKELSYQPLPGKVDATHGQIFVTCSTGETCDFRHAGYGLPGHKLQIGGHWYTIRTDTVSDALSETRLYLGDANGRETGYLGDSQTRVAAYEWTKGYVWTVSMLQVDSPLGYLRAKIPRLLPSDATIVIKGSACDKCYYLPTHTTTTTAKPLTVGKEYFIDVIAFNANGKGLSPADGAIRATPRQVPNAPSNVDLVVVSGKEIDVFFSPPAIASTTNADPEINSDISSYIVQWDVKSGFEHGLALCASCAVSLKVNVLTVTSDVAAELDVGSKFTIAEENCVLTVAKLATTRIDVDGGHGCANFNTRAYPLYHYVYEPAVLSGLLIQGSPPFRYLISDLIVATKYYVRVAAVNSVPVQQIALDNDPPDNRKWSVPLAVTTSDTVPAPPVSVTLSPFSGTTLEVQIQVSKRDGKGLGGTALTHLWIDVDTVSTFDSPTKVAPAEVSLSSSDVALLFDGGPRVYYLKNLLNGVRYFVQVKAKNSIGYSRATMAPNPLAPTQNPDGPVNVKVSTVTTSSTPIESATVTWQRPVLNGGLPLTSYKIEWWGVEPRREIQVIEIKWTTKPTTALFHLAFGGGQTGDMPLDVSPENVRSALMNIIVNGVQKVRHIEVSQSTVSSDHGYQWRVTFASAYNAGDQPMIQIEFADTIVGGTDLTGRVFEAVSGAATPQDGFPGKPEVQVLMTYHATLPVGGYFRLSYKGSPWSNYLSASSSAENLKFALESLSTIGKVTVRLEGVSTNGLVWTITFDSNVGNVPALLVDSAKITPLDAFVGVKDGDNAVGRTGILCVPGDDGCPGTWAPFKTGIAARASPGEVATDYQFYETMDANTLTYKMTGLKPGYTYYVSVTAKNARGLGTRGKSAPLTITPPLQVPGLPTNVRVDVNYGVATQLTATWEAPRSDGGDGIRMYRVEYDPSPLFKNRGQQDFWCPTSPTYAVWKIQTYRYGTTGDAISTGYFNILLTRNNVIEKTEPIPWNAVALASEEVGGIPSLSKLFCTACPLCTDDCGSKATYPFSRREKSGSLQSKLEYLSSINSVQVTRTPTAAADGGYTWTITFMDTDDNFSIVPESPHSLTCSDPATCTLGDYRVTATKIKAGVRNPPCTGAHIIPSVGALNKGQLYYVRVVAYNKIGFGLPALAPNPQKPMVVPGLPTGVTLQVMSASDLKVLFSPPDDDGGDAVTAYQVEWSTDDAFTDAQSGVVSLLAGGAPYYRVISSLTKGTYYFVRVKANNSQGYGQYQLSSPASLNPYTTPSAPTQVLLGVTSSTMLTVQWNVPDDDGGSTITAYVVQWDISAGFDSLGADATKAKIANTIQRSYTIASLTPETVYYVRVFAVNSGGLGTPQTATPPSQIPANTRPGKPHSLEVAATAATGTLQVNWEAPRIPAHSIPCAGTLLAPQSCAFDAVYGGSSFASYLVEWSDNSSFTNIGSESVTTNSALLTGLDSGKLYYVRVLTVNSERQKSDFCARANASGYLCPDNLVLPDGTIITGALVAATPK